MDYSVINDDELMILNEVIKKFKRFKTQQIVEYMHEEIAYKKTKEEDIIPYSLAKEIRGF